MARASFGTVFKLSTIATSTGILTPLCEVISVSVPSYTANVIDVTNQSSPDNFKEYVIGVRDAGNLTITANYISSSSGHTSIIPTAFANGSKLHWGIVLGGTSSMNCWYGYGYITAYSLKSPLDEAVTFDVGIKVTGKPVGPADTT